ncbi:MULTISPECIES: hypothetical protein [Streptomyces]|uniref:Uncharacterized protein n=1 Tax=Streptomyces microflavus TaxID=1919 RepID=A0ABV1Q9E7_STRMI|nr:hypothetical protein [Streptomyces sp. NRRL S-623]
MRFSPDDAVFRVQLNLQQVSCAAEEGTGSVSSAEGEQVVSGDAPDTGEDLL